MIRYYTPTTNASTWYLPSGGVIDFNTADVTITHSANALTFAGATTGYDFQSGPLSYLGYYATYAGNQTLSEKECRNGFITVTATATITLPAVTGSGMCVTVYSTTAAVVHVDANANDRIVLDGTALDDGDKVSCDAVAGNWIVLFNDTNVGWRTLGKQGAWVDGGS